MRLSRGFAFLAVALATPVAFAQPEPDQTGAPGEPAPPPPDPTMTAPPPPPPPPPGGGTTEGVPAVAATGPGPILPNMIPIRTGATIDFRADYSHYSEDTGLFGNTLRIKPPMCINKDDADYMVAMLDEVLTEISAVK